MSEQHELGEHAPMEPPKKVVVAQVLPQTAQQTWYPKEHVDKAEEAGYQQERKPPTPEEMANYEREYVYGSHLQPGLERSPTYLTPREREIQEGKGQELYERSLEERSGILVRAEERSIAEQQYQERLAKIEARGIQGPVSFYDMISKIYGQPEKKDNVLTWTSGKGGLHGRLTETQENLTILQYKMKGYELVGRTETELLFGVRPSHLEPSVSTRPSRWSELKDFGQDIANVKANAGTSSLSRTILALQTQIPDVVKKYGIVGLGSPTAGLIMGGYEVAAFESLINPYAPGLVEGLTSGKQALVGTLVGEAALMVIGGKVFSWMVKGTPNPLKLKATSWLSGSYEEATKAGELWQPSISERIVMKVTGAKPQLSYGEVSIPVVETVSKTGVISPALSKTGVPIGKAFTDIGWELTEAPRMGGVFITKVPTVTTPKALALFFGIGEELISFDVAKGRAPLRFDYSEEKAELVEKGLPKSMLDESYYPKVGSLDIGTKEVNVRGVTAWSKWPTTRSLMEEQKLLPFVTQTQLTRMGIFPYVPDMAVGETTKSLGSAFLVGLGTSLLPKAFSQARQEPKKTLPSLPKLEPLIKLKQPTFEEPFEIQKLKMGPSLVPAQKEKQRAIPLVTVGLGLESLTKAVSVQSSTLETEQEQVPALMSGLTFMQETEQVQSLAQIQRQIQKQVQSLTSQFKTPSLQRPVTPFSLPSEAQLKRKGKKRAGKRQAQGLYLWEFEILEPGKAMKKLMGKRK